MKNLSKVIAILISIMVSNQMFSQVSNESIQKDYLGINIQKVIEVGNERYYLSKAKYRGGIFNNTVISEKDSLYNFSIFKIVDGVTVWNTNILKVQRTDKYYQNCDLVDFSYNNGKLNLMYMVDTIQNYVMVNWVLIDSGKIVTKPNERCVKNMVINPLNGDIISTNKANNKFLPYDYGYGYFENSELKSTKYKNSLYVQSTTSEYKIVNNKTVTMYKHILTKYRILQNYKIDSVGSVIALYQDKQYNFSIFINDSDIYLSGSDTYRLNPRMIKLDTNLNIKNFSTNFYSYGVGPQPIFSKSNKIYLLGRDMDRPEIQFLTTMDGTTGAIGNLMNISTASNSQLYIKKFLASNNGDLDFVGYSNDGRYLVRISDDLSSMKTIKYDDNITIDGGSVLSDNIQYTDGSITFYEQRYYSFHRITIGNQAIVNVIDEYTIQNDMIYPNPSQDGYFNIKGQIGFVKNIQGYDVDYKIFDNKMFIEQQGVYIVKIDNEITKIINSK